MNSKEECGDSCMTYHYANEGQREFIYIFLHPFLLVFPPLSTIRAADYTSFILSTYAAIYHSTVTKRSIQNGTWKMMLEATR